MPRAEQVLGAQDIGPHRFGPPPPQASAPTQGPHWIVAPQPSSMVPQLFPTTQAAGTQRPLGPSATPPSPPLPAPSIAAPSIEPSPDDPMLPPLPLLTAAFGAWQRLSVPQL
jgi:hypothetical protein